MRPNVYFVFSILAVLGFFACGDEENTSTQTGENDVGVDASADANADTSITDTMESEAGDAAQTALDTLFETCSDMRVLASGTLCAIQPSLLDPETKDIFGTNTAQERAIGFGHHTIGIPDNQDTSKGLWIHIGGTYGRPYDPDKNTYPAQSWLNELMAEGYIVVQVAYDNRRSVNDDCRAPNPGAEQENCAGEIREEVLTGNDASPFRETDKANSFDYRLEKLLSHIAGSAEGVLPASLSPEALDWSQIRVSGHSQGGNMAYYIARFRGVTFACMLASPYDLPDQVNPSMPPIADWFKEGTSMTPTNALGQLIASEDPSANAFRGAANVLGLIQGQEAFEVSEPPYTNVDGEEIDGHAAPLGAAALASFRAQACLRD